MQRRHGCRRALAVLLTVGCLLPLPGLTTQQEARAVPVSAATAQSAPTVPTVEHWLLGGDRLKTQLESGFALEAQLRAVPGYLPVADRGAAQALRLMLANTTARFEQARSQDGSRQALTLLAQNQPLFALAHSRGGDRDIWHLPALDQTLDLPKGSGLVTALLGLDPTVDAFSVTPETFFPSEAALQPVQRLLEVSGGQSITVTGEVLSKLLGQDGPVWLANWQLVGKATVTPQVNDQGQWNKIRISATIADGNQTPWPIEVRLSRSRGERRQEMALDIVATQDKRNDLHIVGSLSTTRVNNDQLRHEAVLSVSGKLRGYSLDGEVSSRVDNTHSLSGDALTEQIRQDIKCRWKSRDPAWAHANMSEWRISATQKGTLTSFAQQDVPVRWEGTLTVTATCGRNDFLSVDVPWSLTSSPAGLPPLPTPTQRWESLGQAEQEQLTTLQSELLGPLKLGLLQLLDENARTDLWLAP